MTSIIFTTALALSMDALAVAVSCGVSQRAKTTFMQFKIGLFFGLFQGIMPVIGWLLASSFAVYIRDYDHWIAFFLLGFIGLKMIKESRENTCGVCEELSFGQLISLSIATSIDALAAGISFAILDIDIFVTALTIGLVTFTLSFLGARFGMNLGRRFQQGAEAVGGIILILIGTKILVEHTLM